MFSSYTTVPPEFMYRQPSFRLAKISQNSPKRFRPTPFAPPHSVLGLRPPIRGNDQQKPSLRRSPPPWRRRRPRPLPPAPAASAAPAASERESCQSGGQPRREAFSRRRPSQKQPRPWTKDWIDTVLPFAPQARTGPRPPIRGNDPPIPGNDPPIVSESPPKNLRAILPLAPARRRPPRRKEPRRPPRRKEPPRPRRRPVPPWSHVIVDAEVLLVTRDRADHSIRYTFPPSFLRFVLIYCTP